MDAIPHDLHQFSERRRGSSPLRSRWRERRRCARNPEISAHGGGGGGRGGGGGGGGGPSGVLHRGTLAAGGGGAPRPPPRPSGGRASTSRSRRAAPSCTRSTLARCREDRRSRDEERF